MYTLSFELLVQEISRNTYGWKNKLFISILLNITICQCIKTSHGTFYITTSHNIRHVRSLKRSKSVRKNTETIMNACIGRVLTIQ